MRFKTLPRFLLPQNNNPLMLAAVIIAAANANANAQTPATTTSANNALQSTKFIFGGYIKLDALFSSYSDGEMAAKIGRDFFIPATIPTSGEASRSQFDFSAKTSRFFIKTETPTARGSVLTHIEMDFIESLQGDERFTNGYAARLRHAYLKWNYSEGKSVTAGQTWSNFFNVSTLPELVDFVGPAGTTFMIQSQLTMQYGNWKFSAENPTTTLYAGTTPVINENNPLPDFTASYGVQLPTANYSIALLARELAYHTKDVTKKTEALAINAAAKFKLGENDDIRLMVNYGDGLGRYMGMNSFMDAYTDIDGDLAAISQIGGFIALRHLWNNQWRSTLAISASKAEYPTITLFNPAEAYESVHANLMFNPIPFLDIGVELLYGTKEMRNHDKGDINRVQFGMKYTF